MKKIFVLLLTVGFLTGCYREPQSSEIKGNGVNVEFLFEKDNIKVYRFFDGGRYHYFTSKGETMSTVNEGKHNREENIY
jgi:hypothetical protein